MTEPATEEVDFEDVEAGPPNRLDEPMVGVASRGTLIIYSRTIEEYFPEGVGPQGKHGIRYRVNPEKHILAIQINPKEEPTHHINLDYSGTVNVTAALRKLGLKSPDSVRKFPVEWDAENEMLLVDLSDLPREDE